MRIGRAERVEHAVGGHDLVALARVLDVDAEQLLDAVHAVLHVVVVHVHLLLHNGGAALVAQVESQEQVVVGAVLVVVAFDLAQQHAAAQRREHLAALARRRADEVLEVVLVEVEQPRPRMLGGFSVRGAVRGARLACGARLAKRLRQGVEAFEPRAAPGNEIVFREQLADAVDDGRVARRAGTRRAEAGADAAVAAEAERDDLVAVGHRLRRRDVARRVGHDAFDERACTARVNREEAVGPLGGKPQVATSLLEHGGVVERAAQQIVHEGVERASRRHAACVVAHVVVRHAREEDDERVEQPRLGIGVVAHHHHDERKRSRRLEREHRRRVFADGIRVVDDEAVLRGPRFEPLVELELPDVLLGVVSVLDELDGDGVIARDVPRVREQLERGVDHHHVVDKELLAQVEEVLHAAILDEGGVELLLPSAVAQKHAL